MYQIHIMGQIYSQGTAFFFLTTNGLSALASSDGFQLCELSEVLPFDLGFEGELLPNVNGFERKGVW